VEVNFIGGGTRSTRRKPPIVQWMEFGPSPVTVLLNFRIIFNTVYCLIFSLILLIIVYYIINFIWCLFVMLIWADYSKIKFLSYLNQRPVASHWQTLSQNIVSPRLIGFELTTLVVIGTDCIGSNRSNYHTIMTTMPPFRKGSWTNASSFISIMHD
jgi:hypothetical protein